MTQRRPEPKVTMQRAVQEGEARDVERRIAQARRFLDESRLPLRGQTEFAAQLDDANFFPSKP